MNKTNWKTIRLTCPTAILRRYNDGDMTDTILDLSGYCDRALARQRVTIAARPEVRFHCDGHVSDVAEYGAGEYMEMTMRVTPWNFDFELLETELRLVEMDEGVSFFEEVYDEFVPVDRKKPADGATIHVALLDEGTNTWRPVLATALGDGVYRIESENLSPESETWQFTTGQTVRCEMKDLSGGPVLVAVNGTE